MIILTLTSLTYLGLYLVLNNMTSPVKTVTVSSEGPAAEMYPDSMGQYKILKDIYRNNRAVYKHVDREDRFIIFVVGDYGDFWEMTDDLNDEWGFLRNIHEREFLPAAMTCPGANGGQSIPL